MKVGDKYVIEIEEIIRGYGNAEDDHVHEPIARIKGFNTLVFDQYGLEKLEPYEDNWENVYRKGYEDGKNAVKNESEKITSKDISDAYNKGLNDAWDAAREIMKPVNDGGYSPDTLNAIFGELFIRPILKHNTGAEAIAKIKAYEEQQKQDAEIKVGDEVIDNDNRKGIVMQDAYDCGTHKYTAVWYGFYIANKCIENLTKTGRHFPQIAEVLAELRGEE